MSDAPAAVPAAPATDAPAGAPAVTPAPAPSAAVKTADKPAATPAKAPNTKPWVNPHIARRAAPKAPAAPAVAKPAAPAATPVDPAARLAQVEAEHKSTGERLTRYEATLKARVAQDLAALPERVRATIERRAGGDPVLTLQLITDAHEMGVTSTAIPTGATTAPPPPSAGPHVPTAADNDAATLATFQKLQQNAPVLAQVFRLRNDAAISRALGSSKN